MSKHITFIATNPPIALTWEDTPESQPKEAPQHLLQGDRFLCRECGEDITHSSLRVAVDGAHRHMMPRSFGPEQEYGCFSLAPGSVLHNQLSHLLWDTDAHGIWRLVSCAGCGAHLGWHHQNQEGLGFYLLALENLKAAADSPEAEGQP